MYKEGCIFCEIAQKNARSKIILESDEYMAFENINPGAPVHILVIPKNHVSKEDSLNKALSSGLWAGMISAANEVIKKMGLDKTGYRLVNNGAGYNIVDHEHIHILGGQNWRPKDNL